MDKNPLIERFENIDREIAKHENAIKSLRNERVEIEKAMNVLSKYGVSIAGMRPERAKKPITELIMQTLLVIAPATPADVVKYMQENFGGDLDPNTIRPTLWRMAKDGRLVNDDGYYMINAVGIAPANENGEAEASPDTDQESDPDQNSQPSLSGV
jgi:hypothetical protein